MYSPLLTACKSSQRLTKQFCIWHKETGNVVLDTIVFALRHQRRKIVLLLKKSTGFEIKAFVLFLVLLKSLGFGLGLRNFKTTCFKLLLGLFNILKSS